MDNDRTPRYSVCHKCGRKVRVRPENVGASLYAHARYTGCTNIAVVNPITKT